MFMIITKLSGGIRVVVKGLPSETFFVFIVWHLEEVTPGAVLQQLSLSKALSAFCIFSLMANLPCYKSSLLGEICARKMLPWALIKFAASLLLVKGIRSNYY